MPDTDKTKVNMNILIVHDGGAISSHGFFFDDSDELEGAAERSVRVRPFRALKVSHLQDVVILLKHEGRVFASGKSDFHVGTVRELLRYLCGL